MDELELIASLLADKQITLSDAIEQIALSNDERLAAVGKIFLKAWEDKEDAEHFDRIEALERME